MAQRYLLLLLFVTISQVSKVNANDFSSKTALNVDLVVSKDLMITVEVWPKEILNGDCYYVTFTARNSSDKEIEINPHDLFYSNIYKTQKRIPGIPNVKFTGNSVHGSFGSSLSRVVELGKIKISPKESKIVFVDRFIALINKSHLKQLGIDVTALHELQITNVEQSFRDSISCNATFQVLERSNDEEKLIYDFLHRNMDVAEFSVVETEKGVFPLSAFFKATSFGPLQYVNARNLPDLSHWVAFEEKLSAGTFRDEIRLGRIMVQYLDGDEAALEELRNWLAEMNPTQSMALAAAWCLPEGMENPSEKDAFYMRVTIDDENRAANENYMAMLRELDKILSPYNTLPKRKLREKPAF